MDNNVRFFAPSALFRHSAFMKPMRSGSVQGGQSEDATMAAGNVGGASEDSTFAPGTARGAGGEGGAARIELAWSGNSYNPGELLETCRW